MDFTSKSLIKPKFFPFSDSTKSDEAPLICHVVRRSLSIFKNSYSERLIKWRVSVDDDATVIVLDENVSERNICPNKGLTVFISWTALDFPLFWNLEMKS